MKKILFITTQYRVGERIYPIFPSLSEEYEIHLLLLYQMNPSHKWPGNFDIRTLFHKKYSKYFTKVIFSIKDINYNEYNLILCDDNRLTKKWGSGHIYNNKKCLMVGCNHGNTDGNYINVYHNKAFDKCFVFGNKDKYPHTLLGGIPANDGLKKYISEEKKHILVICNILGNHPSKNAFRISFDEHFFKECGLVELQQKYKKEVVIKLKSRNNGEGYEQEINYLKSILPKDLKYKILVDVEDDNLLISQSFMVISAPSTLAFKPIQLQIPTAIIKDSGANGCFYDFIGFTELKKENILETLETLLLKPDIDFIKNNVEGGLNFNSTKIFINQLKNLIR